MKTNLVVPNENYEIAHCIYCGGEFIRRLNNSTKQLGVGIKGMKAINCSAQCAKDWRNLPESRKRKIKEKNNG